MELHFEEMLGKITEFMKSEANTETVVGKAFELGEFTCVPVIKLGMGFGSGGGEGTEAQKGKGQGAGGAAGMGLEPIGFLVTKGDQISFLQAGKTSGLAAAFEKVPDLIEKLVRDRKKEEEMA
jgi:uncharacterized spore protein YtfJ